MILSHLKLKNWRNFRSVDIDLGKRIFIVGPNASGKSNLLDVFRFLRDIAKDGGGLQKAVKDRGGLSKIRCLSARQDPHIGIEVTLNDGAKGTWIYAISFGQEKGSQRRPILVSEKVRSNCKDLISRPEEKDTSDRERLTETYLEHTNTNESFREIARYFRSITYLHIVPQLLRHAELFPGPSIPDDPFGKNFLETVAMTPVRTQKKRLRSIGEVLTRAVPQLGELTFEKDKSGIPHLYAKYKHWRPAGAIQSEREFSDGTLRLLGFLWSLLSGDSLLLLEEPELSLHPGVVRRLPGLIWQALSQQRRQVFVSTHSSEMLSSEEIDPDEVVVLTPSDDGTEVRLASKLREVKVLLEQGFLMSEIVIPKTEPPQLDLDLRYD